MKNNQILIWPSWTWKSTKWKELAKLLWKNFIDFDNDILEKINQQTAINIYNILNKPSDFNPYQLINTSVAYILDLVWSDDFIKIEEYLTLQLELNNTVLATSWSQVLSDKAMQYLNKQWDTIYLNENLDNIMSRASQMKLNRIVWMPFDLKHISNDEIIQKYKEIMELRLYKYEKYSHITYINDKYKENKNKSVIKNKNWIPFLNKWSVSINYKKDKKLNINHFFNFLRKQWIINI